MDDDKTKAARVMADGSGAGMTGKPSGFRALLGYRVTVWREGYAEIELELDSRHMNSIGIVHGGLYATLLDAVCGHAATWCAVEQHVRACVTVSLTTSFLDAVSHGRIVARGHLECVTGRNAVCRAEVVAEDGRLLAVAQGSFRYSSGSELSRGVPRSDEGLRPGGRAGS